MSTGVEHELAAAFESASEFVHPHPELAQRARAGARSRRRRAIAAAAAVCAAVMLIAGTTYAAAGRHHAAMTVQQRQQGSRRIVIHHAAVVGVSGKYLYALVGPNLLLTAYDRTSGKMIRRVTLPPPGPSRLAVGPGGLVWVSFDDSFASHTEPALWLLSPDLRLHSALTGFQATSVLPVTRTSAWIAEPYLPHLGLLRVHMPLPGQSGTASAVSEPDTSLGRNVSLMTAPGGWSVKLGGRIVVILDDSASGGYNQLVLAGSPNVRFGGPQTRISAMTTAGNALWATTDAGDHGEAYYQGPLVRLSARLRPSTPGAVRASPILARSEDVWSDGHTIWVATGARGHSLVCFTAGSRIGPLTTLPVSGEVNSLAATATTVYVTAGPPGAYTPPVIVSYPVPASCR
ncbi:MAG TPA: hypothetical protein VMB74_16180 [Streptosporangiaceae bacterium]|nr:hypothetical protein [Streptosporangiaceae bacterium]